jgi:phosphate transport system protein
MPRGTTLQQSLEDLIAEVIDLGKEVENSIETMLRAMETRDADLAQSELGVDARYKARGAEAERDCMIL